MKPFLAQRSGVLPPLYLPKKILALPDSVLYTGLMAEIPEKVRGLYLVAPHGSLLARGEKRAIVKARKYKIAGEWLAILEDQHLLGVAKFKEPRAITLEEFSELEPLHRVSEEERRAWWPRKHRLYYYEVNEVLAYPSPIEYDVPPGTQVFLKEVRLLNRDKLAKVEPIEKLKLEQFRAEGVDDDLRHPKERRQELQADLRYLAVGYDRTKRGLKWGDWTLEDVLRYFGSIVDTLREKVDPGFAPEPPQGDPKWKTNWWKCYAEAKKRGYLKSEPVMKERELRVGKALKPFASPGGQSRFIELLLKRIPPHKVYVEPYAGSATLFWAKEPSEKEVLADINPDIIAMYKFLQTGTDEDFQWMRAQRWSASKTHFERLKQWQPKSLRERAYRFKYLNLFSTLGQGVTFSSAKERLDHPGKSFLDHLERFREGLQGVELLCEDALKVMQRYDGPDTFFYLDPPWKPMAPGPEWRNFDKERFEEVVKNLKGKVLISYQGDLDLGDLFSRYSFERGGRFGFLGSVRQTLYWNYELPVKKEKSEAAIEEQGLGEERLKAAFEELPDAFVVVPDWASLTGSAIYGRNRRPHDLDVILRLDAPAGSLLKLERALKEALGEDLPVQFSLEPQGPTWAHLPLYTLVAVKNADFEIRTLPEPEFEARFYKADVQENIAKIKPLEPIAHYKAAGEFYKGEEEQLWDKWARRAIENGEKLAVQPKADGFRLHLHKDGEEFAVFTENGLERSSVFPDYPQLMRKLPAKSCILDVEAMAYSDAGWRQPQNRWEMAWIASAKEPHDEPVCFWAHDILWLDGRNLTSLPYLERLKILKKLIGQGLQAGSLRLAVMPTKIATGKASLLEGLKWADSQKRCNSEGAMVKFLSFKYDTGVLGEVVKYKTVPELDTLAIGWRKIPAGKPPHTHWTKEEAFKALPELLKKSNTYIFRCALRSEEDPNLWIPLEGDHKLSASDLKLDWDEEKQTWTGTDDPKYWTMLKGWPERGEGEFAYGNTYACKVEDPSWLKEGLVITVRPAELRPFQGDDGKWHVSWQHPLSPNPKEPGSPIGTIEAAFRAYRLDPKDFSPLAWVRWPK